MSEQDAPIRVLYVDADAEERQSVSTVLAEADARLAVSTAADVTAALTAQAEAPVDCVVSRQTFPDSSGIDLLEATRRRDGTVPFVLTVADGSEALASRAIEAGVSDYRSRPDGAGSVDGLAERIVELVADRSHAETAAPAADTGDAAREAELERTRDLLEQTERIADVGGWEVDAETEAVYWTDNLSALLGADVDASPSLDEALQAYHEADRGDVREAVDRALETGEAFDVEARIRRPDGEIRWVRVRGTPSIRDGEVTRLRGAVLDITDRRRRERVLREMYEVISDRQQSFAEQVGALLELGRRELDTAAGTLSEIRANGDYVFEVVDADDETIQEGDVVPVSATNCEIAARTEQALVLGDVARDAPAETDRTGYTEWGIACYIGAPVFVDDEVYGTFCFYDTEARSGQFNEWEATLVDLMSRWVSYELQRRRTTEELQATNDQLERFVSVVSHDLRNPLNVAAGRLELAMADSDNEHLSHIATAHDRMETLIEDLLDLTRSGGGASDRDALDLGAVVEQSWATVETGEATLVTELEGSIEADESRLRQLFENLLRNAVEHGGDGVTVRIGRLENGFYVEDDGEGIPESERSSAIEAGYTTTSTGTGYGLRIVADVAADHDWDLRLTEGADGGARFEVTEVEFVAAAPPGS